MRPLNGLGDVEDNNQAQAATIQKQKQQRPSWWAKLAPRLAAAQGSAGKAPDVPGSISGQ